MAFTYTAESPESGISHVIDFETEPAPQDIEEAVQQLDAPILAQRRLSTQSQIATELGGVPLNPETGEVSYDPNEDIRTVGLKTLSDKQTLLQDEASKIEALNRTGKVGSLIAGAETVPLGMASLVQALAQRLGAQPEQPQIVDEALDRALSEASANPKTAAVGSALANIFGMRGAGGTLKNLVEGNIGAAGRQVAVNAPINVGIGSTLRYATGDETSAGDIGTDALLALTGGRGPVSTPRITSLNQGVTGAMGSLIPKKLKAIVRGPEAFEGLTQGLRPPNKLGLDWNVRDSSQAMAAIKDLGADGGRVEGVVGTVQAAGKSLNKISNIIKSVTNDPNGPITDGTKLKQKIIDSVAQDTSLAEDAAEVKRIVDSFEPYYRDLPLDEIDRIIEQKNAQLQSPLYNRTIEGKKVARADLDIKAQEAFVKGLREVRNEVLEKALGPEGRKLGHLYGDIADIKLAAQKRYLVALRQSQFSLPEQLNYAGAAGDFAEAAAGILLGEPIMGVKGVAGLAKAGVTKYLREMTKSDNAVTRAFDKIEVGSSPWAQHPGASFVPPPRPSYTYEDVVYASEGKQPAANAGLPPPKFEYTIPPPLTNLPVQGYASGGPVTAGQTFVAGEEGPEVFVTPQGTQVLGARGPEMLSANSSGYVVPNRETFAQSLTRMLDGGGNYPLPPEQTTLSEIAKALLAVLTKGPLGGSTETLKQMQNQPAYPSLQ